MKKYVKKSIVILIMICLLAFIFSACNTLKEESIEYKDVEGGKALYRYSGSSKITSLTIPDEIDGEPVVEIQKYAISSSEYLKTITIGKNVSKISTWAITACPNLEKIIVDENNMYYETDENGVLFNKGRTELLVYPSSRVKYQKNSETATGGDYKVPESVKKICEAAFYLSTNIVKIEFNEGLEEIGDYAFIKCENLTNFKLPSTLKKIGKDSFSYCDSITELTIPLSVTHIGEYAFFSLYSSIKEINVYRPLSEFEYVGSNWLPTMKDSGSKKASVKVIS